MARHNSKTDRRLIGSWRSDRRRTLKDWVWRPRAGAAHRKRVANMFGHLTIRFTRSQMHSDFKGDRRSSSYEVLGSDADSVAVSYLNPLFDELSIQHIHFAGTKHYWIAIGRQREWFTRVSLPRR